MNIRAIAIGITQFLPGWLSSFALSLVFLSVWLAPGWLGWEGMGGLQLLVFIEVATVYGMLYILSGRGERLAWLPAIPVAVMVGLVVGLQANPYLGALLSLHIMARVAGVWSDLRAACVIHYEVLISLVVMGCAWLAVGLLPVPYLAWTEAAVPPGLWWEAISWTGRTAREPYVLPAWGFLYFLAMAVVDRVRLASRLAPTSGPV